LKHSSQLWFVLWSILLVLSASCSTRKNTFVNRVYHTVTSTYNVNFNGREALNKGIDDLEKKRKDNFLEILPIYYYPPKQDLTSSFPSFDRTIEKTSKSVFKHSILIRGKEYVKTMNNAYLMMGKAYFYKQDYNEAKRIFNYIIATYNDWGSVEEASIWLARSEMRQDYFVRAQSILEEIAPIMYQNKVKSTNIRNNDELDTKSKTTPKPKVTYKNKYQKQRAKAQAKAAKVKAQAQAKKNSKDKITQGSRRITNDVRRQYYAAQAEYNLLAPNKDTEAAIANIKTVLQYRPKKDFRVRLNFILGQLYEMMGDQQSAQNWFLRVIKATPEYEMEFSARMHLAVNYDGTALSKKTIVKELNKMLKDGKNEDYRDQIYYAFSEIARIDEEKNDREYYLAKSVAAYSKNDYQRTFSSLALAEIFFDEEEYIKAQAYYDTALMSMPANYPNSEAINQKASVLKDLVDNLNIIQLQDSLQRIAKMSESERNNWVNRMISKYKEEEQRLAKEESDRLLAFGSTQDFANINVNTKGVSNKWYFYNPGLVAQGTTEFYRRFGNRKLEDNWRISNKTTISFETMAELNSGDPQIEESDDEENTIKPRETDPKKPAYYTQDIPTTQGAIDSSNMLIANAMYNAGTIYFDQLNDLKRSNEILQKLVQRFPNNDLVPQSYFLLWVNFTKLKNLQKADEMKSIILSKYPDTDYAKLILDPNYYKKIAEAAKENEKKYDELYNAYSTKQWAKTVQLADNLIEQSEEVPLLAKINYLRAVAIGQIQGEEALKEALLKITQNYPKEPVTELAKIYLSMFSTQNQIVSEQKGGGDTFVPTDETTIGKESPFNTNLDEQHYIIVIVDVHKKTVNDIKYDIANFNSTYFSLVHLTINNFYINQNEQLITVTRFKGKDDALNYYIALTTNDLFSPSIQDKSLTVFAISATNYSIYYNKVDSRYLYKSFFEKNYLK